MGGGGEGQVQARQGHTTFTISGNSKSLRCFRGPPIAARGTFKTGDENKKNKKNKKIFLFYISLK